MMFASSFRPAKKFGGLLLLLTPAKTARSRAHQIFAGRRLESFSEIYTK
jgi:hypothetical protein